MQLTDKNIEDFRELYREHFNKEISRQEALEKGIKLLTLMKAVYKPMTQEEYDTIQKHMKDTTPALIKRMLEHEPKIFSGPELPNNT